MESRPLQQIWTTGATADLSGAAGVAPPDRNLTWLIVGRLGCWGLVVGGIVRVAWVEVRTDVGV